MLKNKGGLSHNIGQNLKNFPRLRRGFPIQGCSFHCFYLGNHCFYRFVCYFFSRLRRLSHRMRQAKLSESSTNSKDHKPVLQKSGTYWHEKKLHLFFVEMRRRRENFEFYDITNRISSAKTVFLKGFMECFRSGNTWKYLKIFGLRPGLWLNPPLVEKC